MMIGLLALTLGMATSPTRNFASDLDFLKNHVHTVVLKEPGGAAVAVVPSWQARVVTSSYNSKTGQSMGFINYPLIASGKVTKGMYAVGGEDRIWIGPEGGQFSLFFKNGAPFDLAHWQTPAFVDTQPFTVVKQTTNSIDCARNASVTNRSGFTFHLKIDRKIQMLNKKQVDSELGIVVPSSVKFVAFESRNSVTNNGQDPWLANTGLISIWILDQFKHSPTTTVILPYHQGPKSTLGVIVNDTYFGKVPASRLKVSNGVIYFRADGKDRTKIGLNPRRAKDVVGSYDPARKLLTIIKYNKPANQDRYVNSMWEIQKHPFSGDVVNSYNDGPPAPGKAPLGPFYEVENSSPALSLRPGESAIHISKTFHFYGSAAQLESIAMKVLGVSIAPLTNLHYWGG